MACPLGAAKHLLVLSAFPLGPTERTHCTTYVIPQQFRHLLRARSSPIDQEIFYLLHRLYSSTYLKLSNTDEKTRIMIPHALRAGKVRVIFTILVLNHFPARLLAEWDGSRTRIRFPSAGNEFLLAGEAQNLMFAIEGKPRRGVELGWELERSENKSQDSTHRGSHGAKFTFCASSLCGCLSGSQLLRPIIEKLGTRIDP
ncbi:hypothetical protein BKA70DRAFT_720717 [Coprinopsis sp. MPI-PUGE-AT-0042]|nr:hypothetical protein BKA70DRAFT_720717 [Coprinopsis sp. MPI-PUGE-AT-0042]